MSYITKEHPQGIMNTKGDFQLFTFDELACPKTQAHYFTMAFKTRLVELREKFGKPMFITSGSRSFEHNKNIGGHPRSLHVYDHPARDNQVGALAVDVRSNGAQYNYFLIKLALELGWSVGVAKTFIHIDRRDLIGLPQSVFGYG